MKNEHILSLQEEVPVDIRKEVYKEALLVCKSTSIKKHYGLCLLLPMLLWDLDSRIDVAPNGKYFEWRDTITAFPEITHLVTKLLKIDNEDDAVETRIEGLEQILAEIG